MAKRENMKLVEKVMTDTGASENAVLKVVGALKEMDDGDVNTLLDRKPKAQAATKKEFRTSESASDGLPGESATE